MHRPPHARLGSYLRLSRTVILVALTLSGLHLLATSSSTQSNGGTSQRPGVTAPTADTPVAPITPAKAGGQAESTRPLIGEGAFNPGANGNVLAIAVQSDEKIVVGGDFTTLGGLTRNHIARLYSDGTVDPNFNPGANGTVNQVLIQPDGKILVAGNFTLLGGGTGTVPHSRIGRLNPDGTLDQYFYDAGVNNAIYGMALQSDGSIVIGGVFTSGIAHQGVAPFTYTVTRNFAALLFSNGDVQDGSPAFNPGANNSVFKVIVQPDDKVIFVGAFTTLGGGGVGTTARNRIGRLNANGSLDTTFNPGANNSIAAIMRQTDGKFVVGGLFTGLGGGTGTTTRNHLGRINTDGSLDTTFNPGANGEVLCLAQQTDGKILVGGNFTALGGGGTGAPSHNFIARLNLDGSLDTTFNAGANGGISGAVPNSNGTIVVGGAFNMLGTGVTALRDRIGLLQPNGVPDTSIFPHNDNFLNGQLISGTSGKIYGVNNGGSLESGEPQHAGKPNGASVWYRWQAPFSGVVNFTTFGSDFDTLLAVYTGTGVNALTPVVNGSNDDNTNPDNRDGHTLTSSVSLSAVSGTTYYIAVDGSSGRTGAFTLGWGPEASISGQVSVSGYRVTVGLIGDDARAIFIPSGVGNYSFQHLRVGGKYQIFSSSRDGAESPPCVFAVPLNFNPLAQTVTNANFIDNGCRGSAAGSISGLVRRSNGIGVAGIAVSITGTAVRNLVTDPLGNYDASDLPTNGNYTVKPSSPLFVFAPVSRTFTTTGDILGADFVAGDSVEIDGQARRSDGIPISSVTITLNSTPARTVQTDALGFYSIGVPAGASYQLTATKTGVNFPQLTLSNVTTNQKNADFVAAAVTISGHVTNINGRGLSGETVTLSGDATGSVQTDSSGGYSFTVTSGGNYDITPTDSQFLVGWSPANSIHHANLIQNVIDNFEARTPAFTVAGVVKNTAGTNLQGVTVRLTGTFVSGGNKVQLKDYSTSATGFTSDALNIFGDYTFTAQTSTVGGVTYGTFAPTSRSFNSILPCSSVSGATCDNNTSTQNYLGADFTAALVNRTLTLASVDPANGIAISLSPADNNGAGGTTTPFTRVYNDGQNVVLTASTTVGTSSFQKWQKDGVDLATTLQTTVKMDADHTLTAVYLNPKTFKFDASNYPAAENVGSRTVTVTRSGDPSTAATVDYATSDTAGASQCNVFGGNASSRCDYETTIGKLNFAAGETSRTISIPIIDDSYAEGNELFTVTLSNPAGATLAAPSSATVAIVDNDSANGTNPIVQARYYVRMHYLDFLNREPDTSGWDFWTNQITNCGSDVGCTEVKRIDGSASFFLSIEFQQTGYLVERTYKAAFGDTNGTSTFNGTHQLTVPIVRFSEFLADTQQITRGVVVLQTGWEQLLESNKVAFFNEFVQRTRFTGAFPPGMTPTAFVDTLNTNAGSPLSATERNQLISDLTGSTKTRAQVLRAVVEHPNLVTAEFNRAFVLMQYFGYLRRNPNDPQDSDYTGYDFWLVKLNQFGGNYNAAEMVKAFITSIEYGRRFGP